MCVPTRNKHPQCRCTEFHSLRINAQRAPTCRGALHSIFGSCVEGYLTTEACVVPRLPFIRTSTT